MKRGKTSPLFAFFILLLLTFFAPKASSLVWKADRFLPGYEETTIQMPEDYSGKVVCTLVRKPSACKSDKAVLYIHGYNDYFFQNEMGDTFVDSCYNFYALDLRKYGRSLLNDQVPYECRKISEYYADIDSALSVIQNAGNKEVVILAHSTGGLIAASYMNNHPSPIVKALILNSPFLDWNMTGFMRKVGIPFMTWLGGWWPKFSVSQGDDTSYAESLLKQFHGEWNYDTSLKTIHPRKVTAGWIRAITRAQKALRKNSDIKVPILLMHSDKSVYGDRWNEEFQHGDAVLNVEHIKEYGKNLGPDVTEVTIPGGLHDLSLSEPSVRKQFYTDIFNWLDRNGL